MSSVAAAVVRHGRLISFFDCTDNLLSISLFCCHAVDDTNI